MSRAEVWTVYAVRVAFEREGRVVQRSYTFPTSMARDRFLEACRPLGGVAVRLGIDHVLTVEQALAELAEDEFFSTEPAE